MLKCKSLNSSCSLVGPESNLNIVKMQVETISIEWTSSFKYLSVIFLMLVVSCQLTLMLLNVHFIPPAG